MGILKVLLTITITISCYISPSSSSQRLDSVKALWNMEAMAECRLKHSAFIYNNYGCWCGVGGSGKPVDGIDRCCMNHDKCYDRAVSESKCWNVPVEYIEPYTWKCVNGEPVCGGGMSACQEALCACDKAVVDCWAGFPEPAIKSKCERAAENKTTKLTTPRAVYRYKNFIV